MTSYFLRRLVLVPVTFLAITFLVYTILRTVPSGPIEEAESQMKLKGRREGGGGGGAGDAKAILTPEARRELERYYALDRSIPVGYLQWLGVWPRDVEHLVPHVPKERHRAAFDRLAADQAALARANTAITDALKDTGLVEHGGRLWRPAKDGEVPGALRHTADLAVARTFGDRPGLVALLADHGFGWSDGRYLAAPSPAPDPALRSRVESLLAARDAAKRALDAAERETGYYLAEEGQLIQLAFRPVLALKARQLEVKERLNSKLAAHDLVTFDGRIYALAAPADLVPKSFFDRMDRRLAGGLAKQADALAELAARGFTRQGERYYRLLRDDDRTRLGEDLETIRELLDLSALAAGELDRIHREHHLLVTDDLRLYTVENRLAGILELDFGRSYTYSEPVLTTIGSRMEVSIQFGLAGFLLSWLICIPLGVVKAIRHRSLFDNLSSASVFLGYAVPGFVVSLILIAILSVQLGWFPLGGYKPPNLDQLSWFQSVCGRIRYMFIPIVGYTIGAFATMTILMKNSLMENLGQDYVRTAFAKGLSERRVIFVHALRNSLIPITTGIGYEFAILFAGSFLIEKTCNIDGMGLLGYQAVLQRDYPIILALLVFLVLIQLFGNILSDIIWALIDPRIRFE